MLAALLAGERDPAVLADLAKRRLRSKRDALIEAFEGFRFGSQNALLIGGILRHIDFLDAEITALSDAIAEHLAASRIEDDRPAPLELAVQLACSLDGILHRTAEMLIGEFGTDMSRFPTDKHFSSWAAQCPGNNQSAGKRRSGKNAQRPEMARRRAARRRDGGDPRQGRPLRPQVPADQSTLRGTDGCGARSACHAPGDPATKPTCSGLIDRYGSLLATSTAAAMSLIRIIRCSGSVGEGSRPWRR